MSEQTPNRPAASDPGKSGDQRNEGEGNRTAARDYNTATQRFVDSGRVEESGARAREAIEDSAEKAELETAERIGKSKIREEDPAVARQPKH